MGKIFTRDTFTNKGAFHCFKKGLGIYASLIKGLKGTLVNMTVHKILLVLTFKFDWKSIMPKSC